MLANMPQETIHPAVTLSSLICIDEHDTCACLHDERDQRKTVCHGRGEQARVEDSGSFCEVTAEHGRPPQPPQGTCKA